MVAIVDDAYLSRYIELYKTQRLYLGEGIYENAIDNNYDSADDDYDSDGELMDNECYNPEEPSITRYNIVLCELYNQGIHGNCEGSTVGTHYLVNSRYKDLNMGKIRHTVNSIKHPYMVALWRRSKHALRHPIFRNYNNIISRQNYIKPEIAECIYLETQECIAILKTFWVRLIQRTWRNVLEKRKQIIRKRSSQSALYIRETTGKWPRDCLVYPGLKGMLYPIKNLH